MATIEPRLIHLLNDSSTPQLTHADLPLPPLQGLHNSAPSDRPLPLEPNAEQVTEQSGPKGVLATSTVAPLYGLSADESGASSNSARAHDGKYHVERPAASSVNAFPLRLLLGETESSSLPANSLSKILDDTGDGKDDTSTKKRNRAGTVKDDFVQLPQPVKKQKATQQLHMPPIINGLHEPPPDAALFPPIAFQNGTGNAAQLLAPRETLAAADAEDKASQSALSGVDSEKVSSAKGRKRATKPRRKWSELETNHLLLGVARHGVGKWTNILEDPEFEFSGRTAGDLKDRFRTCCPDELRRNKDKGHSQPPLPSLDPRPKAKSGLHSENILIDTEDIHTLEPQPDSDSAPKRKTRAHRKKMEDLAELGIREPFKKSHRRERRPFTEQDDREILDGLEHYGPAWTKIQRDPRFHLASRQPTDLRDRVRNKYPDMYQKIEKGTLQIKGSAKASDVLEPSASTTLDSSLHPSKAGPLEPQLDRAGSREELPKFPLSLLETNEAPAPSSSFDFGDPTAAVFMGQTGEMDISRLLLDDSQIMQTPPRPGHI